MSQLNEPEAELITEQYTYAEFECGACERALEINYSQALSLADDKSVVCPHCEASIKASQDGQAFLKEVSDSLVKSGKFMLPFALCWFPLALVLGLFVDSTVSGLMTCAGLLIASALKGSAPVYGDVMRLDCETNQERDAVNDQFDVCKPLPGDR